jgi:hypothetical protein
MRILVDVKCDIENNMESLVRFLTSVSESAKEEIDDSTVKVACSKSLHPVIPALKRFAPSMPKKLPLESFVCENVSCFQVHLISV